MGDVINLTEYRQHKKTLVTTYPSEEQQLGTLITVWTPCDFAIERYTNENWMDTFFYPDEDW